MRKFTIFTVILAVTVIVTVAEMFVNNYLPGVNGDEEKLSLSLPESLDLSKIAKTNAFGADDGDESLTNRLGADSESSSESTETLTDIEDEKGAKSEQAPDDYSGGSGTAGELANLYSYDGVIPTYTTDSSGEQIGPNEENHTEHTAPSTTGSTDFEDKNYSLSTVNVNLRQEQIESAGFFNAYIESEDGDGKLYKTVDVSDLYDTKMSKFLIRSQDEMMARVYIFTPGVGTKIEEVYQLIKSRCGQLPLVSINATNEYGSESFYMNDSSRSGTVFLTARIGQLVYAFSYPKNYHQQVKNLLQLITWEID